MTDPEGMDRGRPIHILNPLEFEVVLASILSVGGTGEVQAYCNELKAELSMQYRAPFIETGLATTQSLISHVEERSKAGLKNTLFILGPPGAGKTLLSQFLTVIIGNSSGVPGDIGLLSYDATMAQGEEQGREELDTQEQLEISNMNFQRSIELANRRNLVIDTPSFVTATFPPNFEAGEVLNPSCPLLGRDVGARVVLQHYLQNRENTFFIGPIPSPIIQQWYTRGRDVGAKEKIIRTYNELALDIARSIYQSSKVFSPELHRFLGTGVFPTFPDSVYEEIAFISEHLPGVSETELLHAEMSAILSGAVLSHNLRTFGVPNDHCIFPFIQPNERFMMS